MDLLWVAARLQKQAEKRSRPRSRRGPLARLGIDPRDELLEGVVGRADFTQLIGDLSEKSFGGTTTIVFDVGQVGRRDAEVRSETPQRKFGTQPEPANLLAEIWWVHVSDVS